MFKICDKSILKGLEYLRANPKEEDAKTKNFGKNPTNFNEYTVVVKDLDGFYWDLAVDIYHYPIFQDDNERFSSIKWKINKANTVIGFCPYKENPNWRICTSLGEEYSTNFNLIQTNTFWGQN